MFIDFDQIFNVSEEQYFTEFVPYDQLVDYFKIGVGFVKNDIGRTVEILNLLIQNLRKQNELLLKVFLTVLNNYYREIYTDSVFKMNSAGKYPSLYSQLVNVQSREMYVLFLTQLLFIETTYQQEFPQLIYILDAETSSNGIELIFNLTSAVMGYKITPNFINIQFDEEI